MRKNKISSFHSSLAGLHIDRAETLSCCLFDVVTPQSWLYMLDHLMSIFGIYWRGCSNITLAAKGIDIELQHKPASLKCI